VPRNDDQVTPRDGPYLVAHKFDLRDAFMSDSEWWLEGRLSSQYAAIKITRCRCYGTNNSFEVALNLKFAGLLPF
jgi:hypothetical protein